MAGHTQKSEDGIVQLPNKATPSFYDMIADQENVQPGSTQSSTHQVPLLAQEVIAGIKIAKNYKQTYSKEKKYVCKEIPPQKGVVTNICTEQKSLKIVVLKEQP